MVKKFVLISSVVVILDQIIKFLIDLFKPNWDLSILKIHLVQNTGAGFGILKDQTFILTIISFLVALSIILYYKRIPKDNIAQTLFALFLGGAVGNLIDRLFRGYVIDFIDLSFWPAFNIADAALSIAVIGLIVYYWKK